MSVPADWQLPPGVTREVWDYLHNTELARRYDDALAGTPLLELDQTFVREYCPTECRILDLGCGTGRVAIPLATLGHRVTAVDLAEEMLRVAGAKATAAGVRLDRVRANIVTLDAIGDGAFDAVLCLFSTLGMVSGSENRRKVVGHAHRVLRPGGVLLLHVHNRWHHLRTRGGRSWLARDVVRRLRGSPDAGDWLMEHHDGQTGWPMHLFTAREIRRLLCGAGFRVSEVRPVPLREDGRLSWPSLLGGLRAYGFLVAARRSE
jgi:SAM-dependent methyltransferase